jgi:hypothetical protein
MNKIFSILFVLLCPLLLSAKKSTAALDSLNRDSIVIKSTNFNRFILPLQQKKEDSLRLFSQVEKLHSIQDPLSHIENVGFRFFVRDLELKHDYQIDSVDYAVHSLLDYVKNDSLRNMVEYLKKYIENRKTEQALRKVKKQINLEEVLSYQPNMKKSEEADTEEAWKLEALKKVYSYVEKDPVHQWIREISRDSVLIGVRNYLNDSIRFWINNGRADFQRFWLKKNRKDSIGIWVQNTNDRSIRILVDDDVFQQSVEKTKKRGTRVRLNETMKYDNALVKLRKYKRYTEIWKVGAEFGLNFNQGHVSKSWSGDGQTAMATLSTVKFHANYKKGKHTWDNTIEAKYGLLKSGEEGFRKNEDKLEINTKYGQKAFNKWYYSALFNLKTQMLKGYDYPDDGPRVLKSQIFAPAYVIITIGLDYKPNKKFSVLLSPIAAKYTIVGDTSKIDQTQYGLAKDERVKKEVGSYANITHTLDFWEDMKLENKMTLYSNYSENPKNVDIDWQMTLTMPINQYLSTKVSTHVISDDDTSSKIQFKENLMVGFSYRF